MSRIFTGKIEFRIRTVKGRLVSNMLIYFSFFDLKCEEKCGLTQETRTAHCATQDGKTYPDEKCDPAKKPQLSRECENPKSCDYQWYTSQWSKVGRVQTQQYDTKPQLCYQKLNFILISVFSELWKRNSITYGILCII